MDGPSSGGRSFADSSPGGSRQPLSSPLSSPPSSRKRAAEGAPDDSAGNHSGVVVEVPLVRIKRSNTRINRQTSRFIHDVSTFIDEHPGGRALIKTRLGRDATTAFYGGYYDHSNGANTLLAQYRVGVIEGGYEVEHLKRFSKLIEDLKESGADGVAGKSADLQSGPAKVTVIKGDPQLKSAPLINVEKPPNFNDTRLTGGLGHPIKA
ncbi:hypothetical protein JCM3770_005559 [Rhodotorula araucariae]